MSQDVLASVPAQQSLCGLSRWRRCRTASAAKQAGGQILGFRLNDVWCGRFEDVGWAIMAADKALSLPPARACILRRAKLQENSSPRIAQSAQTPDFIAVLETEFSRRRAASAARVMAAEAVSPITGVVLPLAPRRPVTGRLRQVCKQCVSVCKGQFFRVLRPGRPPGPRSILIAKDSAAALEGQVANGKCFGVLQSSPH